MTFRQAVRLLLVFVLGLPVVQAVLFWVSGLLVSMGDGAGAAVLRHIGTGCLVFWIVAIVALVIVLALTVSGNEPGNED
jgi:hypothetical protein